MIVEPDLTKDLEEISQELKKLKRNNNIALISAILSIFFLLDSRYNLSSALFNWVAHTTSLYGAQFLVAIVVVSMGVFAHWFKRMNQAWYGGVECAFGVIYGISTAFGIRPGEPMFGHWATLVGCIYIIARGLNNISDARGKARTLSKIVAPQNNAELDE